jgi:hypothetical protein
MVDVTASEHPRLYRAITDPTWLRVRTNAFKLRPATNKRPIETDLSVLLSVNCTKAACDIKWSGCVSEFILNTAAVIADGWRVVKDDPASPHPRLKHASILDLPLPDSDELEIELAASRLADLIDSVNSRPT